MVRLPPSRHTLHCGLRIPDLRARDDSPLRRSCHHVGPASCRTRRLRAQTIRRCGLNATFRTRLQRCDGDWWPLSLRHSRVAHAAPLGTNTEICDTVRLGGCSVRNLRNFGGAFRLKSSPPSSTWFIEVGDNRKQIQLCPQSLLDACNPRHVQLSRKTKG